MFKIIVERPRIGHNIKEPHPVLKITEETDLPSFESIKNKKNRKNGCKRLNENLSPLYRFLKGKVGQNWNDVWSEICEHLDNSSTVKKHVKDHAKTYFERVIKMIDGVPHKYNPNRTRYEYNPITRTYSKKVEKKAQTHNSAWEPFYSYNKYRRYYINPETNIIEIAPVKPNKKDPPPTSYRSSQRNISYKFYNDIWWLVKRKIRTVEKTVPIYGYYYQINVKDGEEIKKLQYGRVGAKTIKVKEPYEDWNELKGEHLNIFLEWLKTNKWNPKLRKNRMKYFKR